MTIIKNDSNYCTLLDDDGTAVAWMSTDWAEKILKALEDKENDENLS